MTELIGLIAVRRIGRRTGIVGLATRRTWRAALFVIPRDVGADRSATMQLRTLVATRPTADFGADGGQSGSGGNTLENKRLCAAVHVVNPHGALVDGLPLPVRFAAAIENAASEYGPA